MYRLLVIGSILNYSVRLFLQRILAKEEGSIRIRETFAGFKVPVDTPDFVVGMFHGGASVDRFIILVIDQDRQ
jgi:hypothetical protein